MADDRSDPPVFIDPILREWADEQPWHHTPPLLVGFHEGMDERGQQVALSVIEHRFDVHHLSAPERIGYATAGGLLVSCEDLRALADLPAVTHVEIAGYLKVGI